MRRRRVSEAECAQRGCGKSGGTPPAAAIGMDRLSSHCVFYFLHELALPKDFGCISVDSRSTLIEFIIEIELFF